MVSAALKAGALFTVGGTVSGPVADLVREVLRAMFIKKLKSLTVLVGAVCVGLGLLAGWYSVRADDQPALALSHAVAAREPVALTALLEDFGAGLILDGEAAAVSCAVDELERMPMGHQGQGPARLLARENAAGLGVADRFTAALPDRVPADATYHELWSNPPIRIGKDALHDLLLTWLPRIAPGGRAVMVVGKNLGADSLQRWLGAEGWPTERLASAKGFRVLETRRG